VALLGRSLTQHHWGQLLLIPDEDELLFGLPCKAKLGAAAQTKHIWLMIVSLLEENTSI
jgi:hypothetical protein